MDIRHILPDVDIKQILRNTEISKTNNLSTELSKSLLLLNTVNHPERLLLEEISLNMRHTLFPENARSGHNKPSLPEAPLPGYLEEDVDIDEDEDDDAADLDVMLP